MPLNLVVQTAFLGDLLLAIPLLKRCKEQWPKHQLALVCRKGLGEFFLRTKLVDQVFEIQKGDKKSYKKIIEQLKSEKVDYLISPHQSLRTTFFCRQISAQHKIGYKNLGSFFAYKTRIKRNQHLPDALRQMSLLETVDKDLKNLLEKYQSQEKPYLPLTQGQLSKPPNWASMSLRKAVLNDEVFSTLQKKFSLKGFQENKAVLIFPGSVWATKRWTEEGFIKVGQALQAQGFSVYIMGGPGEEELAERVAAQIPSAHSLAGKTTIFESSQLIARASLLVGNDSASTHLAAVCETPLIAIFGPTILEFGYRPWSAQSFVVQKENLSCRPCGKHGHQVCPIKTHVCMKDISADEVLKTAGFILRPSNP